MSDSKKDYSSLTFEELSSTFEEVAFPYVCSNLADGWEDNPFENVDFAELKKELLQYIRTMGCTAMYPRIEQGIETLVNRLQQNKSSPSDDYVKEETQNYTKTVLHHWIDTIYECLETKDQVTLSDYLMPTQLDSEQEEEYDDLFDILPRPKGRGFLLRTTALA